MAWVITWMSISTLGSMEARPPDSLAAKMYALAAQRGSWHIFLTLVVMADFRDRKSDFN